MKSFVKNVVLLFVYLFFLGVFNFLIFTTSGTLKIIGLFVMILFCINRIIMTIKDFFDETPSRFESYADIVLAIFGIVIFYIVILNLFFESMNILALLLSLIYLILVVFIIIFLLKDFKKNKNEGKRQ